MCVFQDICGIGEPQREIDPSTTIIAQRGISPLFTISKEGDESAKNVDIINYF